MLSCCPTPTTTVTKVASDANYSTSEGQGCLAARPAVLVRQESTRMTKGFETTGGRAWSCSRLHAVDVVMIHELLEVLQVVPPLEEEGLCDEAEPGCDLQFLALGLFQHLLQLLLADVTVAFDLIGVWTQLHFLWRDIKKRHFYCP